MKKTIIISLLLLTISSVIAADYDYTGAVQNTEFYSCLQFIREGQSINLKANIQVDKTSTTLRDCYNGYIAVVPYSRYVWLKKNTWNYQPLAQWQTSSVYEEIPNTASIWNKVFSKIDGTDIIDGETVSEVLIRDKIDGLSSPLSRINSRGTIFTKETKIPDEFMAFYYSLSEEDYGDMTLEASGSFADISSCNNNVACKIYGFDVDSTSVSDTTQYSGFLPIDGTGHMILKQNKLDNLRFSKYKGLYTFTNDINYYYYPFYVDLLQISIKGYSNSSSTTQIFGKLVEIEPTSHRIKIKAEQMNKLASQAYKQYDANYPDTTIIDSLDFGTQIIVNQKIAELPTAVTYVEISYSLHIIPNSLYRHISPVDYTGYYNYVSNGDVSDCSLIYNYTSKVYNGSLANFDELCDPDWAFKNIYLQVSSPGIIFNIGNGTNNIPSTNESLIDTIFNNSNQSNTNITTNETIPGTINANTSQDSVFTDDWSSNPGDGGALQNQLMYIQGTEMIEKKQSFFEMLKKIQEIVFIIFITAYTVVIVALTLIVFFVLVPSAYRKFLSEFKKLTKQRWN